MTIRQTLTKHLTDNGMFPNQAESVMTLVMESEPMRGRWNDEMEGYPPQMKAVLLVTTNRLALKWIDENLPLAWYRPMFELPTKTA